jgi:hypothetical protein
MEKGFNKENYSNVFVKEDIDLRKNGEGYADPTAYEAIKRIQEENAEYERVRKVIGCILRVCEISDFHLEEKLVLRDKRTGKVWY